MATSDGDVIMADSNGNSLSTAESSSVSISHIRRSDHDRKYYFLPQQPLKRSRPHVSQEVIFEYGLEPAHKRIRRTDEEGNKINKMRKSYAGIVRNLHIAGSNKEGPAPGQWLDLGSDDPNGLMDMKTEHEEVDGPDGEKTFQEKLVWKKELKPITKAGAQSLLARLGGAVQMAPGALEDPKPWKTLLGEEPTKKPQLVPPVAGLKVNGTISSKPSPRLGPAGARGQRMGAKRSYDEASFSGYHETYDDVDRTAPGDVMRKKQRKVPQKSPYEVHTPASKTKISMKGKDKK